MKTKMCPMCGGECLPENGDFVCTCCGYTIEGEQPAPVRLSYKEDDGESVYSAVAGAVAEIKCNFSGGSAAGSGFLISRDGYCVTNAHVVTDSETFCPAKQIFVTIAGETVSALLIAVGDKRAGTGGGIDLALLKLSRVPNKAAPVAFGSSAGTGIIMSSSKQPSLTSTHTQPPYFSTDDFMLRIPNPCIFLSSCEVLGRPFSKLSCSAPSVSFSIRTEIIFSTRLTLSLTTRRCGSFSFITAVAVMSLDTEAMRRRW